MMKVLHVISRMEPGGAESLVKEMVGRGESHGWVSGLASGGGALARELAASQRGVAQFEVPVASRNPWSVAKSAFGVRRALRSFRPDVVLAHNVGSSVISRAALLTTRRAPLVTLFHGVAASDVPASATMLNRVSDHVVACSSALRDKLVVSGLQRVPTTVIPNAISPVETIDRAEARSELGLSAETGVVLCLARMAEQKRHDILLRAWRDVPGDCVLLLAGAGPLRAQLEELARSLGIEDRVRFLGVRRDVPTLLSAADLTVLASDWEGLPIAVLESMAAGVPVVATDVDGVGEALADGGGRLVPSRDPSALAHALTTLLADRTGRERLGQQAREKVNRKHAPEVMMGAYDRLFHEAAGRKHGGRQGR